MLLFNNTILFNFIKSRLFQYITCYYSTLIDCGNYTFRAISIHHMLLFNMNQKMKSYICEYFNTSFVVIQPINKASSPRISHYNTSYVIIKRVLSPSKTPTSLYLNTTYVIIKPIANLFL